MIFTATLFLVVFTVLACVLAARQKLTKRPLKPIIPDPDWEKVAAEEAFVVTPKAEAKKPRRRKPKTAKLIAETASTVKPAPQKAVPPKKPRASKA